MYPVRERRVTSAILGVPQFYLGGNKKAVSSDGISEEERKAFGVERFVAGMKMPKKGAVGLIERGTDVTVLGLKLSSPE